MMKLHRQLNVMRTANWDSCSISHEEVAAMRDEVDARIAELTAEVASLLLDRQRLRDALNKIGYECAISDAHSDRMADIARNALKEG